MRRVRNRASKRVGATETVSDRGDQCKVVSDGTNKYNRLLGFVLWIKHSDGRVEQKQILRGKKHRVKLPISGKEYKVTLRNLQFYLEELQELDSSIVEVCIDRLSRVGVVTWEDI